MSKLIFPVFVALFAGCGAVNESPSVTNKTASGYPAVEGEYTFIAKPSVLKCKENGRQVADEPMPEIAIKEQVTQKDGDLTITRLSKQDDDPNFYVGPRRNYSGILHKDGHFNESYDREAKVTVAGITISGTVFYTINGNFTDTGWSGEYQFSYILSNAETRYIASCSYISSFTGERSPLKV